jgi:iron complex transport system permease protein
MFIRWLILGVLALAVLIVAPLFGLVNYGMDIWFCTEGSECDLFWFLRVLRVATAFFVGGCLATVGLTYQTYFRNLLATPYTLGVASGAACGASILTILYVSDVVWFGLRLSVLSGLIGAGLVAVMLIVSSRCCNDRYGNGGVLLLTGLVVSLLLSNIIVLMQYIADFGSLFKMTRWLMGSLHTVGRAELLMMLCLCPIGLIGLWSCANSLNLLALGEEFAVIRGCNLVRIQIVFVVYTSLIIGTTVSACGPIPFVGHVEALIGRKLFGHDHRTLIPAVFLLGGIVLVICDTMARLVLIPVEIPVGIITGIFGALCFVAVIIG